MRLTIPNQLTILRILLTPVFIYLILQPSPLQQLYGSLVFTVGALTDWYDGWYARKFGVITRFGQFMDPLADKILVSSALIVFEKLNYVFGWMVYVIIIRDFLITFNRIYALTVGRPIITHVLAKWKTALQMITIFMILIFINIRNFLLPNAPPYQPQYFDVIGISMSIVTALTVISGAIYIIENRELILGNIRHLFRF
jgi:CDP-diacylglycerol--glycerol-3-phosphate 3-phosphatidyltransferase